MHRDLYSALCVVDHQEWLPLSALAALWDMNVEDAEYHLHVVALYSLATVRGEAGTVVVGLHDLRVDWVRRRLVPRSDERQRYHAALLNWYGFHLGGSLQPISREGHILRCQPWWNLPTDGYEEHALCRHLHAGGPRLREELQRGVLGSEDDTQRVWEVAGADSWIGMHVTTFRAQVQSRAIVSASAPIFMLESVVADAAAADVESPLIVLACISGRAILVLPARE